MDREPWETVEESANQMILSHDDVSHFLPGTFFLQTGHVLPSADTCQVNNQLVIATADVIRSGLSLVRQTSARDLTAPLTAENLGKHVRNYCTDVGKFLTQFGKEQRKATWHLQKSRYTINAISSDSQDVLQRLWVLAQKINVSLLVELPETTGHVLGLSEQNLIDIKKLFFNQQSCPFRKEHDMKVVYEQYGFVMSRREEDNGHSKMWAGWRQYLWLKILADFEIYFQGMRHAEKALIEFQEAIKLSETAPEASTGVQQQCQEKCLFCDYVCSGFLVVEAGTYPQVTDEGVFCDQLKGEMCEVIKPTTISTATVKDIQRFDYQNGVFICIGCFPGRNQPPEIIDKTSTVYQTHFFWRKIFTINPTNSNNVELYISNDTSELRNKVSKVREIDHLEARRPETRKRLREDTGYSLLCERNLRAPLTKEEGTELLGHFRERDLVELITWYYASRQGGDMEED